MSGTAAQKSSPWIWVALLMTIALTVWTLMQDDAADLGLVVKPSRTIVQGKQSAKVTQKSSNRIVDWEKLKRREKVNPIDLFSATDWSRKRKKLLKPKVVGAPPPSAPPVPFTYMGRMDDGPNGDVVYLADHEKSYSVAIGDKVGPFWRLDNAEGDQLLLTYLPLNLTQTLSKNQSPAAGF